MLNRRTGFLAAGFVVAALLLTALFLAGGNPSGGPPTAATTGSSSSTSVSVNSSSSLTGPRLGLDLTWYARNSFGTLHGINTSDGGAVYTYLTHGWKDSNGQSGGFFTAYSYELHDPPLYPPQYISDANWLLSFIHVANSDAGGQRAKIFVRLVPIDNFDPTLVGTLEDFLHRLGPTSQNPSVVGFGFRGGQEGIYEGGGTCCANSITQEGSNFVPANVAYGPSGLNSFPQNVSQFDSMWSSMQSIANSYGYPLGVSTSLSVMDKALKTSTIDAAAQWFINDAGYGVCTGSDLTGSCTANDWQSKVLSPPRASSKSLGVVGGEWDQNWFVPNQAPYNITQAKIQGMFEGFSKGYAKNPQAGQYMFIYGMPYLTNDDSTWIHAKGPCPYMGWFLQYAQKYGFFTDFSQAPRSGRSGGGSAHSPSKVPTGLYIHILGNSSLDSRKPGYSQTHPVYCCGKDNFTMDGQLISLQTGQGVPGANIQIMSFNFTTCRWQAIATVTTDSRGYYGRSSNSPLDPPIILLSPPLPNTGRNQAYYYPAYLGDSTYGPSNGVLEDIPVLPPP